MSYIILDRDGVINYDSDDYIKSPAEWQAIPGSLQAIAKLNQSGYKVLIVTNQSGISRGYFDLETLNQIHSKLSRELAGFGGFIEDILFCPHLPDDQCLCRKPKPGLLYKLQEKHKVNMAETFFIGDSHVDIKAATISGCKPLLVLTGKGEQSLKTYPDLKTIPHFSNLRRAVDYVISNQRR